MSTESNKAFILRYFEAMNKDKSPASVDQCVADSDPELKEHIAVMEAAFPGYQLRAEDLVAEGDKVAVRVTVTGTHQGEMAGIPPTGKTVSAPGMLIYRIAGGKIVEHWMAFDDLGVMQQLGVIPAP
jgi:predicted ester cyclase